MVQKYVAQPKENGKYEVARFNEITRQYEHVGIVFQKKMR